MGYLEDKYGSFVPTHGHPLRLVQKAQSEIYLHLCQHCFLLLYATLKHAFLQLLFSVVFIAKFAMYIFVYFS